MNEKRNMRAQDTDDNWIYLFETGKPFTMSGLLHALEVSGNKIHKIYDTTDTATIYHSSTVEDKFQFGLEYFGIYVRVIVDKKVVDVVQLLDSMIQYEHEHAA